MSPELERAIRAAVIFYDALADRLGSDEPIPPEISIEAQRAVAALSPLDELAFDAVLRDAREGTDN